MNTEITTPIKVWQHVVGESLIGTIVGTRQVTGLYGDNRQVLIKDRGGNITAVWLTRQLKKNLKAQCAVVGDSIILTFLGKKTMPGGGYSYNDYNLIVEKH